MKESFNKNNNFAQSPTRKGYQNEYTVPRDFDKTPPTLQPLDYYLLDSDVYSLVKQLFSDVDDWGRWAQQYSYDAQSYFSPPYDNCHEAFLLGYNPNRNEDANDVDN